MQPPPLAPSPPPLAPSARPSPCPLLSPLSLYSHYTSDHCRAPCPLPAHSLSALCLPPAHPLPTPCLPPAHPLPAPCQSGLEAVADAERKSLTAEATRFSMGGGISSGGMTDLCNVLNGTSLGKAPPQGLFPVMHADSMFNGKDGRNVGAAVAPGKGWAGLRAMPLQRHNVESAAKYQRQSNARELRASGLPRIGCSTLSSTLRVYRSPLWGVLGGKTLAKPVTLPASNTHRTVHHCSTPHSLPRCAPGHCPMHSPLRTHCKLTGSPRPPPRLKLRACCR